MAEKAQRRRQSLPDAGEAGGGRMRLCAVTRSEASAEDLIRFVRAPDGVIVPDLDLCLPGRGVWVSCLRETLEKAIRTKSFARSLHTDAAVPPDLAQRVDGLLERRVIDALALANKAGAAIAGFQQVDAALDKAAVLVLLHGSEAAADGRAKLDRKFQAICRARGVEAPIIGALTVAQMSLAMGRPSVVHAALIPGGLARRFLREAGRLARYRSLSSSGQAFSLPDLDD